MVNPFISVDEQLHRIGWNKFYENDVGFRFVKKMGNDIYFVAEFDKKGIRFLDDLYEFGAIRVNEPELELFKVKIKEWRKQYGRNTESRSHTS